jgi:ABC-type branched-subunit amino acid transport system substrate-binding protein
MIHRLAVVLVLVSGVAAAETNPIVIGQSIALSGGLAEHGKAVRQGALAYIEKINAHGGIGGRSIVLKSLDDRGDPQLAAEHARYLIDEEKVLALFGGIEGGPCVAALKIAAERKAPLIACMAGSPELREPFQRYSFPVRIAHVDEFAKLIDTAATYGYRKIAFLHSDSETGRNHLANVRKLLAGHQLELALAVPLSSKDDPSKIAQQLEKAGIEAMFNHGSYMQYADIIRESRRLQLQTQFLAINSGAQQMSRYLGKDAHGVIFTQVVPNPWGATPPVVKEFQIALKEFSPGTEISFSAMEGFVSAKVLVEALRRAGKTLTRDGLVAALETMQPYDLGGMTVSFSPNSRKGADFVDTDVVGADGRFVR